MRGTLSIVIPVGPGDTAWQGLLPELACVDAADIALVFPSEPPPEPVPLTDPRLLLAIAPTGRARQMNAGVAATTASWLWFLHADSRLTPETLPGLHAFIARNEPVLGYFDLQFQDDGPRWMQLNALGARLRSRWLGLPFGDQGLVIPRRVFETLGGFDDSLGSAEDHALIWRARRARIPIRPVNAPLLTSARKYAQQGWWLTTRSHLRLTCEQAWAFSRLERVR
ncbi:MAG: glycosyltransferase [Proteobacteria bacterium]|nr:glycosyltransferase [Pseudomonadota bacterium]